MERLKNARIKVVGTKQTQKAIEKGQTQVVYVARDAEERIISPIARLCEEKGLELVPVDSMAELGKACGIKVGAAAAAALFEDRG
jgi:large subunit ribosomal protein L7A